MVSRNPFEGQTLLLDPNHLVGPKLFLGPILACGPQTPTGIKAPVVPHSCLGVRAVLVGHRPPVGSQTLCKVKITFRGQDCLWVPNPSWGPNPLRHPHSFLGSKQCLWVPNPMQGPKPFAGSKSLSGAKPACGSLSALWDPILFGVQPLPGGPQPFV